MEPKPPNRKSLWNTPIREVVGDPNIHFPNLNFLVGPILAGVGIFLIIFFGYKLIKGIGEMFAPVIITDGTTITEGISSGNIMLILVLAPLIFFMWRPIRRLLRDIGD